MPKMTIFCLILIIAGCHQTESVVKVSVDVKTHLNDPVSGARVAIDGEIVGETDGRGLLKSEQHLQVGTRHQITISKTSELHYFAPFEDNFVVSDSSPQELNFPTTMFFVPKQEQIKSQDQEKSTPPVISQLDPQVTPQEAPRDAPRDGSKVEPKVIPQPEDVAAGMIAQDFEIPTQLPQKTVSEQKALAGAPQQDEKLIDEQSDDQQQIEVMPQNPGILTVHVRGESQSKSKIHKNNDKLSGSRDDSGLLSDVEVTGSAIAGQSVQCKTNHRGRCVLRFHVIPKGGISLIARKKGFHTVTQHITLKSQTMINLKMSKGQTLDIEAFTRAYGRLIPLSGVNVSIDKNKISQTNSLGRMSYHLAARPESLVQVKLEAKGYLPEVFETDFATADSLSLTKMFTPQRSAIARIVVTTPQLSVNNWKSDQQKKFSQALVAIFRQQLFSQSGFKEYPLALFERRLQENSLALTGILRQGFATHEIGNLIDGILVVRVKEDNRQGKQIALELNVIGRNGEVLAGVYDSFDASLAWVEVQPVIRELINRLCAHFPYEGAVISREADLLTINLGRKNAPGISINQNIAVHGLQIDSTGSVQDSRLIGAAKIVKISDQESQAKITTILPRAQIQRGDMVTLRSLTESQLVTPELRGDLLVPLLRVTTNDREKRPIRGVNLYVNGIWRAISDADGLVKVMGEAAYKSLIQERILRPGVLVLAGFEDQEVNLMEIAKIETEGTQSRAKLPYANVTEIELEKISRIFRVQSMPSGATVSLGPKVIGRTPLELTLPLSEGETTLVVSAGSAFKEFRKGLDPTSVSFDFTGAQAIHLEADFLGRADRLVMAAKASEAAELLDRMPTTHTDFTAGKMRAGELFLNVLNEPERAIASFAIANSNPKAQDFKDRRFIISHINQALAHVDAAEKLRLTDDKGSRLNLDRALNLFTKISPYLSLLPQESYQLQRQTVEFNTALVKHRLALLTGDSALVHQVIKSWRAYLSGLPRSENNTDPLAHTEGEMNKSYKDKAQMYLNQAMTSSRKVNRDAKM